MFFFDKLDTHLLWLIPTYWSLVIPLWTNNIYNIPIGYIYNGLFLFLIFVILITILKNKSYYKNWFLKKNSVYLIGWKPWNWKTRLMSMIMSTLIQEQKNLIICSNYANNYSDCFYSSREDFYLIQQDIQLISCLCNFTFEEKKEIEKQFNWYFNFWELYENNKKIINKIVKLNKKINFVTFGDEFHLYLHNRSAMSNFSGEKWKKLLELIHQTRHSKQLLIIATQDTDSLDLDLRQIADKEIETREYFFGLFFGFNLYYYLNSKFINPTIWLIFKKINKIPFFFFNWFLIYEFFEFINFKLNKIYYKIFKKNLFLKNLFLSKKLKYNTNFNVNIWKNIYKSGDIFTIIYEKLKD